MGGSIMTDADIAINKFKNGNISMKLLNPREIESDDPIYNSEDLFMNDLYFHIDGSGWLHIIDAHTDKVYPLNDYGYDNVAELRTGKTVRLYSMDQNDSLEILEEWRK